MVVAVVIRHGRTRRRPATTVASRISSMVVGLRCLKFWLRYVAMLEAGSSDTNSQPAYVVDAFLAAPEGGEDVAIRQMNQVGKTEGKLG